MQRLFFHYFMFHFTTFQNWGDWRPHLAMILSNAADRSDLYRKSILTLGDTLLEKGLLYGAHFCYLVGNLEFGTYSNRNSKFVLIGSDRRLDFESFATNEAIQCTEIFEYAQKLSNQDFTMKTLVYYKFVYIIRFVYRVLCLRIILMTKLQICIKTLNYSCHMESFIS